MAKTRHRLTREQARRVAIRAQRLDAERPRELVALVEQLAFVQLDPTAAVAPSADLVAWSRIGNAYDPAELQRAIEHDRTLFEHRAQPTPVEPVVAVVRPMADLGLFLADMATWSQRAGRAGEWVAANKAFRRRVLDQLRAEGPLPSRAIPDRAAVPWESTGWTHERNVTRMLEFLAARGEIAVAARRGRQRLWDVAERVYPPGVEAVPAAEAHRRRSERWLRALGVARPQYVGDAGEPAEVDGTTGEWRVDPGAFAAVTGAGDGFAGRTALLSPFDRLVHDRTRAVELFDFEYTLEMYKPKAQRRWGYFALPVLHGDRLVGKVDATADRKRSVLRVDAVHPDGRVTKAMAKAIDAELEALAAWLGLERVERADRTDRADRADRA
jgi:uncharacterized protein YcaQ